MDTKEIYEKTKIISKGNLWNMFMTSAVFSLAIGFIKFILDKILPTVTYGGLVEDYLGAPKSIFGDLTYMEFAFGQPLTYGLVKSIIFDILSIMSFLALIMAVLDFVKDFDPNGDNDFTLTLFTENLRTYKLEIFLTALVFTGISTLTSLIPYIGLIINIIFKIILFFVGFIIKENCLRNPFILISESFKRTRGYKFDLFKLMVKYRIPLLVVLVLLLVPVAFKFTNTSVFVIGLLIILAIVIMRAVLFTNIAFALTYEELVDYENFKTNFARGRDYNREEIEEDI